MIAFKKDDIITNGNETIIIKSYTKSNFSEYPEIVYNGIALTRKLQPYKNKSYSHIYGSPNIKKLN